MLKYIATLVMGILSLTLSASPLADIKNISQLTPQIASAGLPTQSQFNLIKQQGYQTIISLLPGVQLREQRLVESLDMQFAQVPVDWMQPTLANFEQFVTLMQRAKQQKVFVHCQLNWRASTFVYLYRITQLGHDSKLAEADMLSVWQPQPHWQAFIDQVKQHYAN